MCYVMGGLRQAGDSKASYRAWIMGRLSASQVLCGNNGCLEHAIRGQSGGELSGSVGRTDLIFWHIHMQLVHKNSPRQCGPSLFMPEAIHGLSSGHVGGPQVGLPTFIQMLICQTEEGAAWKEGHLELIFDGLHSMGGDGRRTMGIYSEAMEVTWPGKEGRRYIHMF